MVLNMFIHATKHRYFAEWRWVLRKQYMQQSIDILQNVNMFIHATKHRYFAEWRWY